MKHLYSSALIAGLGLAVVGAGCGSQTVQVVPAEPTSAAALDATANAPTPSDAQPVTAPTSTPDANAVVTSTPSDSTTSSTTSLPTPTTMAPSDVLAFPGVLPESAFAKKFVHLQTTKGEIVFELLPKEGPKAASNYVYLVNRKFYDGLTFHRVIRGFMIQGGDPLGTGTGGPGYQFEDDKVNLPYNAGIVAMANAGPNTNGSQFFIMDADTPLQPDYSVFGRVVKGLDVVHQIVKGDKMLSVTLESN